MTSWKEERKRSLRSERVSEQTKRTKKDKKRKKKLKRKRKRNGRESRNKKTGVVLRAAKYRHYSPFLSLSPLLPCIIYRPLMYCLVQGIRYNSAFAISKLSCRRKWTDQMHRGCICSPPNFLPIMIHLHRCYHFIFVNKNGKIEK